MRRWQPSETARLAALLAAGVGGVAVQIIGIAQDTDPLRPASLGMFLTLVSGLFFLVFRLSQES